MLYDCGLLSRFYTILRDTNLSRDITNMLLIILRKALVFNEIQKIWIKQRKTFLNVLLLKFRKILLLSKEYTTKSVYNYIYKFVSLYIYHLDISLFDFIK